jgi:hypothetical protein
VVDIYGDPGDDKVEGFGVDDTDTELADAMVLSVLGPRVGILMLPDDIASLVHPRKKEVNRGNSTAACSYLLTSVHCPEPSSSVAICTAMHVASALQAATHASADSTLRRVMTVEPTCEMEVEQAMR